MPLIVSPHLASVEDGDGMVQLRLTGSGVTSLWLKASWSFQYDHQYDHQYDPFLCITPQPSLTQILSSSL